MFGIGDKKEIDISQLIEALSTFNIRSKQANIVEDMVNYLLDIPTSAQSKRSMLCSSALARSLLNGKKLKTETSTL